VDFSKEIKDRVFENGSLEEKCFLERSINTARHCEDKEMIRKIAETLRGDGYTPAEIKGFFEFASRICNFIKGV